MSEFLKIKHRLIRKRDIAYITYDPNKENEDNYIDVTLISGDNYLIACADFEDRNDTLKEIEQENLKSSDLDLYNIIDGFYINLDNIKVITMYQDVLRNKEILACGVSWKDNNSLPKTFVIGPFENYPIEEIERLLYEISINKSKGE